MTTLPATFTSARFASRPWLLCSLLSSIMLVAASCASDREQRALIEEIDGAASVGGARSAVYWRRVDLETRNDLNNETRVALLAECKAIDAQADALTTAIDASERNPSLWKSDACALDARVDAFLASYPPGR